MISKFSSLSFKNFYVVLWCSIFFSLATATKASEGDAIFIDFAPIGDAGNKADWVIQCGTSPRDYGRVDLPFSLGIYDVTAEQYCSFLNAVATKNDPHDLYNPKMNSDENVAAVQRSGSQEEGYHYSLRAGSEKLPITYVTLFSAMRFCNWLENGMPVKEEGPESTEDGSYLLIENNLISTNPKAHYFLPNENQWYKAAYYKGNGLNQGYWNYPTKSNWAPNNRSSSEENQANYFCGQYTNKRVPNLTLVGFFQRSPGPYGTFDMGGNVFQWTSTFETMKSEIANPNDPLEVVLGQGALPTTSGYIARGGSWDSHCQIYGLDELHKEFRHVLDPNRGYSTLGFRIACSDKKAGSLELPNNNSIVNIELVTVGDPGNKPNFLDGSSNPYRGGVDYIYKIAKYCTTVQQYTVFLNAIAQSKFSYLYHEEMSPFILRSGSDGEYHYSATSGSEDLPITLLSKHDMMLFANWMEMGQLRGKQGEEKLLSTSYIIDEHGGITVYRNVHWLLPTDDEWHKAAYYDSVHKRYWKYPTGSDIPPGPGNIGKPKISKKKQTGTKISYEEDYEAEEGASREAWQKPNQANYGNINRLSYYNTDGVVNTNCIISWDPLNTNSYLTPVGACHQSLSPYGTFDMGGNVFEVTCNFDPKIHDFIYNMWGGSWYSSIKSLASSAPPEPFNLPSSPDIGFRLVYHSSQQELSPAKASLAEKIEEDGKILLQEGVPWFVFKPFFFQGIASGVRSMCMYFARVKSWATIHSERAAIRATETTINGLNQELAAKLTDINLVESLESTAKVKEWEGKALEQVLAKTAERDALEAGIAELAATEAAEASVAGIALTASAAAALPLVLMGIGVAAYYVVEKPNNMEASIDWGLAAAIDLIYTFVFK